MRLEPRNHRNELLRADKEWVLFDEKQAHCDQKAEGGEKSHQLQFTFAQVVSAAPTPPRVNAWVLLQMHSRVSVLKKATHMGTSGV
jgi:hypothetical protein